MSTAKLEIESSEAKTRINLSPYEAIMTGYIQGTISHEASRYLADWLECREYIYPQDRSFNPELYELIKKPITEKVIDMFNEWLLADTIQSTMKYESQEKVLKWIRANQSLK